MQKIVEIFAQRAGIIGQSETTVAPTIERFAELIVQECINACGSDFGTELIKKHFGVER
jgi:hypothetical protein